MALEIKLLDYGDIELESSFLVLGRDCGRTRRVLTLGFLITGGAYPIVVDTDLVSYFFKGDSRVRPYMVACSGRQLVVSFMTIAELKLWAI